MEALLLELDGLLDQAEALVDEPEQFDQWWALTQRCMEIAREMDA